MFRLEHSEICSNWNTCACNGVRTQMYVQTALSDTDCWG